ncbi:GNAT family N-acetyltransferase [Sporosarcina thermotolerans]|uniref:GNAT family N-acetyltransferase n=1 Tax=Sporosarcina thermotolerans TaxID=633404 RepID=UPI0024BBEB7F|nr:GNAT family N-acetyltransferase [Sporosarcina thermotolerans]WHT49167.1 GNAT family N-acetyltransferase [Sporosarcina thermotolerans]
MQQRIDNEFSLMKANPKDFAIHYTTYRENVFFRQSWERRVAIFGSEVPCYWLLQSGRRIGGVCLEPNMLWSFFLEPPFTESYRVLRRLKKYLKDISEPSKPLEAIGILPYQAEHFLRLGFKPIEARRIMIRPTEQFDMIDWGTDFFIKAPTTEDLETIAQLSYQCYSGADRIGHPTENTIEQQRSDLDYYFKHNGEELLQKASRLIFDKNTKQLVGACLISIWEDLPLVYDIVVDKNYRGRGIASKLLKHSLSTLKEQHDVVCLFVTVGNPAESLYYDLGFLPGMEQTTYSLPR